MRLLDILLILVTMIGTVTGQLAIKSGVLQVAAESSDESTVWLTLARALMNWRVILGLAMAVVAACAWILALSRMPLSYAYPFLSVTFPAVVILSSILFDEHVSSRAYIGLALVIFGLLLASWRPQ